MRLVLIGGTGFLGRHCCVALSDAAIQATTISFRPDHRFLAEHAPTIAGAEVGSAEAEAALAEADVVIHLGSLSRPASNQSAEAAEISQNVDPALRLFAAIAAGGKTPHVIYASSGGQIYGPDHAAPIHETAPCLPVTPYGLGKQLIEDSLRYYERRGDVTATILRLSNPAGRWQIGGKHGFISAAVTQALRGEPLTLFGEGGNVRDYFDADAFAAFVVDLVSRDEIPSGTFNIGSGVGRTEREIIDIVEDVTGERIAIDQKDGRPFDFPYAVLNCDHAERALGWRCDGRIDGIIQKMA
ncbi:MAG: NAD-dependent epimerase/dehydratase family protein, partial [Pseudomonadota bacterium]